jgi:hypothetical protein
MSFNRLDPSDFVVSTDAISSTLFTNNSPSLTSVFTSSVQVASSAGNYYVNVYNAATTQSVQFAIAYGNEVGSGSLVYNTAVDGKSPTGTIWGQWQDLVLGDENTRFVFGNVTSSEFFALPMERARYKDSLFLGSLTLSLSGSSGSIQLTDNSNYVTSVAFSEAGRVFQLITGSAGIRATINQPRNTVDGYSANSGSYGWLLPDIGTILLNPMALADFAVSGGIGLAYSGSFAWGNRVVVSTGSQTPAQSANVSMLIAISRSMAAANLGTNGDFYLNAQESITSDFIFVRPRSSEFNYSENPSFISGSTGEVLYPSFINNPQTYITTVGLYNDNNELLAVAKLSRPLPKDFTKEALIRVKLDF